MKSLQRLKKFDVFAFSFSLFQCPRQHVSQTEAALAIFYTYQTSGTCAGVCACDRTHHMEKPVITITMKDTSSHIFIDLFGFYHHGQGK